MWNKCQPLLNPNSNFRSTKLHKKNRSKNSDSMRWPSCTSRHLIAKGNQWLKLSTWRRWSLGASRPSATHSGMQLKTSSESKPSQSKKWSDTRTCWNLNHKLKSSWKQTWLQWMKWWKLSKQMNALINVRSLQLSSSSKSVIIGDSFRWDITIVYQSAPIKRRNRINSITAPPRATRRIS